MTDGRHNSSTSNYELDSMNYTKSFFLTIFLVVLGANAMARDIANPAFSEDAQVQVVADIYAKDAVTFAKKQYGIALDWTDGSMQLVDNILEDLHKSYAVSTPRPSEEKVMAIAKGFGSYIGEVFRKNHGAQWGVVTLGDQSMPGLKAKTGVVFWPWARAWKRIIEGPENNIVQYYQFNVSGGK